MIRYTDRTHDLRPEQLEGFFEGWPHPPTVETHLRLLHASDVAVVAIDDPGDKVAGFATAITDRVLCAYLSFLEVLPEYRYRGVGQRLVREVLDLLGPIYMVDTTCDAELQPFYAALGMQPALGMVIRDYSLQAGKQAQSRG